MYYIKHSSLLQTKPKAAIYFDNNKKLGNGCELEHIMLFPIQNEKKNIEEYKD